MAVNINNAFIEQLTNSGLLDDIYITTWRTPIGASAGARAVAPIDRHRDSPQSPRAPADS